MKRFKLLLPLAACVFPAAAWSASGAASTASSATSAASNSIAASSASLTTSSKSSSNDNRVAAGDYTIIHMALADEAAPGQAAKVRLTLRATDTDAGDGDRDEFVLLLPKDTVVMAGLAAGDTVTVRHRAYGIELAGGATRQPFFLVLDDAWYRELASTRVVL